MTVKRILLGTGLAFSLIAQAVGLEEQTYGNTRFLTGGIGQEERQAIGEVASRYNLLLTLAIGTGQYVSDVTVTIKDRTGRTVLDTVSKGPMVLAALRPGTYTVEAVSEGRPLTRKLTVTDKGQQRLVLRWPE